MYKRNEGFDGVDSGVAMMEGLESRLFLAGDVSAVVRGGTLRIVGDAADNAIYIDADGLAAGQIRITSIDEDTRINGQSSVVLAGVTRGLDVRVGGGNDTVEIANVSATALFYDGGAGTNSLRLIDDAFTGDIRVQSRSGSQNVEVHNASARGMNMSLGAGDHTAQLYDLRLSRNLQVTSRGSLDIGVREGTAIGGKVTITSRSGSEIFTGSSTIRGSLSVRNHQGGGSFIMDAISVGGNVTFRGGRVGTNITLTDNLIDGTLRVRNTGRGVFFMSQTRVSGSVVLQFGSSADSEVTVEDSTLKLNLRITTGSGNDTVTVVRTDVFGTTRVNTGRGDDTVTLNNSFRPEAFWGSVSVSTGRGNDTVNYGGDFFGAVTFNGGPGQDTLREHEGAVLARTPRLISFEIREFVPAPEPEPEPEEPDFAMSDK